MLRLARRGFVEDEVRRETVRRVPTETHLRVDGVEHLRRVLELGRGALLLTAHLGSLSALTASLLARHYDVMLVAGSPFDPLEDGRPDASSRREAGDALRAMEAVYGSRVVLKGGSYEATLDHLRRGAACLVALDVRGSVETTFVGGPTRLPAGPAALALEAGAPVVPTFPVRRRGRSGFMLEPILPADFPGHRELHEHLAAVVEDVLLAHAARNCPGTGGLPQGGLARFSSNLAGERAEKGLSRAELADRAGVPRRRIARMEQALVDPRLGEVRRLARALDSDPRRLLRRLG